jgi:hypothetical protein
MAARRLLNSDRKLGEGLLNHLVSERQQSIWYVKTERLRSRGIDHEFKPRRLLDRQVSDVSTFEVFAA